MARDKGVIVSFRVDKHLADVLNKVPDKSSFIRDVILRSFYETCPVCRGRGVLPEEVARWATQQLASENVVECSCCHYGYPKSALPQGGGSPAGERKAVCPHCESHEHEH